MLFKVSNILSHSCSDEVKTAILKSNRIILPPSMLKSVIDKSDTFIFRVISNNKYKIRYTTLVYEFTAPEGIVYMSEKMMDYLCIISECFVRINFIKHIKKGSLVKLRPNHSDFTRIVDPKGFLERGILKYYPVLNKGENIIIGKYNFDIIDTEPDVVISTIDTDLSVDFLQPKDLLLKDFEKTTK